MDSGYLAICREKLHGDQLSGNQRYIPYSIWKKANTVNSLSTFRRHWSITYTSQYYGWIGNIYLPPTTREIRFTRSLDHGLHFSTPLSVTTETVDNALPQLAVDRTTSTHRGTIYLTWSGSPTGTYTDILVSESTDFGHTFSFPSPITPTPAAGTQRFQTNPVLAVDNDGEVSACFYQTPHNAPNSSSVYSYDCAMSFNRAATWQTRQVVSSAPLGYDAVTSDFLLHNEGFFTAFELQASGKRHVVGQKFDLQ